MAPEDQSAGGHAAPPVELRRGDVACRIAPALGGSVLSLTVDGRDLLRPAPDPADDVLGTACFPLVPFANRIGRGRFTFRGRQVTLPADPAAAPHAHHGFGWRRGWQVAERDADAVTLVLDHAPGAWSWAFRATQRFTLLADGIAVDLSILNRSDDAMPCGAGLHPYFRRAADSYIDTGATSFVTTDASGLPAGRAAFRAGRHRIADLEGFDNLLLDGSGRVTLGTGGGPVAVTATGMAGFHVYVPPGGSYFCVEPVSHLPDAFQHTPPDAVLPPGERRDWHVAITAAAMP